MAGPHYQVTLKQTIIEAECAVCSVVAKRLKDRMNVIKSETNYLMHLIKIK